jgi:uncharacterized protein
MADGKQIDMVLRDMLFLNWAVEPERVRKLVPERIELDTKTDTTGRTMAFVSAVCFRVGEVRSSALLLPSLSFEQLNYRVYVKAGDDPAVCFLDMKVNSRMVTTLTSFLSVPIQYEDIDIKIASTGRCESGGVGTLSYAVKSAGLQAEVIIGEAPARGSGDGNTAPQFMTDRLVGYVAAGDGVFKIRVEQPGLNCVSARVESVAAPRLEQLGLLPAGGATQPHSALYVREASFGADMPTRAW